MTSTTLAFMLGGCVGNSLSSKQNHNIQQVYKWYINTHSNTSNILYGEGEGYSLEEAKDNALNSIASKLIVSVGSSLNSSTTISTNGYNRDVTKNLKVNVQKIKFTNSKVKNSIKLGDKFYVQMVVNRFQLFKNKKQEFLLNDKRINKQYTSLKAYSKLEQIHILKKIYPVIIDNKKQAIILNAINNKFNIEFYVTKYNEYIDMIYSLKNDSSIFVQTDSEKKYFANQLIDKLNKNQYRVSPDARSDIIIKIDNDIKYSLAKGWNIAKITTTLSIISGTKIVATHIVETIGRSSTSKESALESASINFSKEIEKIGLDTILFK